MRFSLRLVLYDYGGIRLSVQRVCRESRVVAYQGLEDSCEDIGVCQGQSV